MSRIQHPRSIRRALAAALGIVAATTVVALANGEESSEPLRLQFRRDGACPDADAFFRALRARTTKVREARPGERARTLTVQVREGGQDSAGTLAITNEDGASTTSARSVRASSCGDVVEALALMAALAVDPSASLAAPTTSPRAPSAPGSAAPSASASPPVVTSAVPFASAVPPVASAPPAAGSSTVGRPNSPPPPAPAVNAETGPFALGAGAELTSLLGGRIAVGIVGAYEPNADDGPRLVARVTRTLAGDVEGAGRTGGLSMTSGALEPCPMRLRFAASLALLPCARLAAGRLSAEGKSVATPEQVTRTWVDVGASVLVAWRPLRSFSIEPRAELRAPLTRDRFFVEPDATVYRAPLVGFAGGIDAMLHFP